VELDGIDGVMLECLVVDPVIRLRSSIMHRFHPLIGWDGGHVISPFCSHPSSPSLLVDIQLGLAGSFRIGGVRQPDRTHRLAPTGFHLSRAAGGRRLP